MSSEFSVRRLARFPPSTSDLRIANLSELAGVTHRSETAERSVITTSGSINDYALSAARTMDRLMIGMSVEWLRSAISESIDIADASPVPIYGTRTTFSHDFSGLHADIDLLMIGMSVEWLRSAISESIDIADASPVPIYGTRTTFSHDFSGLHADIGLLYRSEERRVGKECRSRWSPY